MSLIDILFNNTKQTSLTEALNDSEKQQVDSWNVSRPDHVKKEISRVFGNEKRVVIPFHLEGFESSPNPEVEEHLHKHGYSIHHYADGIAKNDMTQQKVGIGKVLSRTNAPKHIVSAFANDPVRLGTKTLHGDLQVVISHDPHEVAGMTSRGHSWYEESCMNFNSGDHKNVLPYEVRNGTHVAYLCHKGDDKAELPIARIVLKQFNNHQDENNVSERHTIFRADNKIYGAAGGDLFQSIVNDWSQKKYPAKRGVTYKIADGSYIDHEATTPVLSHRSLDDLKDRVDGNLPVAHWLKSDPVSSRKIMSYVHEIAKHELKHFNTIHSLVEFVHTNSSVPISADIRTTNAVARILHSKFKESPRNHEAYRRFTEDYADKLDTDNLERVYDAGLHKDFKGHTLPEFLKNKKVIQPMIEEMNPYDVNLLPVHKVKPHHIDLLTHKLIHEGGKDVGDYMKLFDHKHIKDLLENNALNENWNLNSTYSKSDDLQKLYVKKIREFGVPSIFNLHNVAAHNLSDDDLHYFHDASNKSNPGLALYWILHSKDNPFIGNNDSLYDKKHVSKDLIKNIINKNLDSQIKFASDNPYSGISYPDEYVDHSMLPEDAPKRIVDTLKNDDLIRVFSLPKKTYFDVHSLLLNDLKKDSSSHDQYTTAISATHMITQHMNNLFGKIGRFDNKTTKQQKQAVFDSTNELENHFNTLYGRIKEVNPDHFENIHSLRLNSVRNDMNRLKQYATDAVNKDEFQS